MTITIATPIVTFEDRLETPLQLATATPHWEGTLNDFWHANQDELPTWGHMRDIIEHLELGSYHGGGGAEAAYTIVTQAKLDSARALVASRSPRPTPVATAEDLAALRSYAYEFGPKWKAELAQDWYNARARSCDDMPNRGGILHGLRNNLGPSWLDDFRFAEPIVWPSLRKITRAELSRLILLTAGDGDLLMKHALRRERSRRASR